MARTAWLTFFYFLTVSIMIIVILKFTDVAEDTLIGLRVSVLSAATASAWHILSRRKAHSFFSITDYWFCPPVALLSHVGWRIAVCIESRVIRCCTRFPLNTGARSNWVRRGISITRAFHTFATRCSLVIKVMVKWTRLTFCLRCIWYSLDAHSAFFNSIFDAVYSNILYFCCDIILGIFKFSPDIVFLKGPLQPVVSSRHWPINVCPSSCCLGWCSSTLIYSINAEFEESIYHFAIDQLRTSSVFKFYSPVVQKRIRIGKEILYLFRLGAVWSFLRPSLLWSLEASSCSLPRLASRSKLRPPVFAPMLLRALHLEMRREHKAQMVFIIHLCVNIKTTINRDLIGWTLGADLLDLGI